MQVGSDQSRTWCETAKLNVVKVQIIPFMPGKQGWSYPLWFGTGTVPEPFWNRSKTACVPERILNRSGTVLEP